MTYLIYDESGEMLDVMDFETPTEATTYLQANPTHSVELTDTELVDSEEELEDLFLNEEEEISVAEEEEI